LWNDVIAVITTTDVSVNNVKWYNNERLSRWVCGAGNMVDG